MRSTGGIQLVSCLATIAASLAYDSAFSMSKALRYVDFSGAAYCADPIFTDEKINNWSCNVCAKYPGVQAVTFHGDKTDANGFVAYDPSANEIIISFSGTDPFSIQAWIDDLDFFKTAYPYCSGCEVHEGFYRTYNSVKDQITTSLNYFRKTYPSASVSITGHSLGASLAAHCAADLVHSGIKINTVYAFGMPRVGNEAFEKWYISVVPGTFRASHRKDPVPHLAPLNWGFHHMAYEIFYTKDYNDWKMCNIEGEDSKCANQYAVDLRVDDHLEYFGFSFTSNYLSCQKRK